MPPNDCSPTLYQYGKHTDLTVKCGTKEFKVHKCVVCPQSRWFANVCEPGRWKEGCNGVIELKAIDPLDETPDESCDDPRAVELMFDFIYYGRYLEVAEDGKINPPASQWDPWEPEKGVLLGPAHRDFPVGQHSKYWRNQLEMHVKLWILGLKYQILGLQEEVTLNFTRIRSTGCGVFPMDFARALSLIYTYPGENDDGLRSFFFDILLHWSQLLQDRYIYHAATEIEGLMFRLFMAQSGRLKTTIESTQTNLYRWCYPA